MLDGCLKKSVSPRAPIGLALGCHEISKLGVIGYLHPPIEFYVEANYHHFGPDFIFHFFRGYSGNLRKMKTALDRYCGE